jgi:hypothetical protein
MAMFTRIVSTYHTHTKYYQLIIYIPNIITSHTYTILTNAYTQSKKEEKERSSKYSSVRVIRITDSFELWSKLD